MTKTTKEQNKAPVLKALDTLFNKRVASGKRLEFGVARSPVT